MNEKREKIKGEISKENENGWIDMSKQK